MATGWTLLAGFLGVFVNCVLAVVGIACLKLDLWVCIACLLCGWFGCLMVFCCVIFWLGLVGLCFGLFCLLLVWCGTRFVLALCSWVADSCFSSRIVGRVVFVFYWWFGWFFTSVVIVSFLFLVAFCIGCLV